MEFENPTRRYKWFRPRQALKSAFYVAATNYAAIGVWNDTKGPQYIVVRDVRAASYKNPLFALEYNTHFKVLNQGTPVVPVFTSTSTQPGTVWTADLASLPSPLGMTFSQVANADAIWPHDFPIAVLEPGWSWAVVSSTLGNDLNVSFLWEAIDPDELDYLY